MKTLQENPGNVSRLELSSYELTEGERERGRERER